MSTAGLSEGQRLRRNRLSSDASKARRSLWWQVYRARIDAGLEACRGCGHREDLTFDHVVPFSLGGRMRFTNATILCRPCNGRKADQPWRGPSLAAEEAGAPPEQQWVEIAYAELRASRGTVTP